jgi:hypothetical protein
MAGNECADRLTISCGDPARHLPPYLRKRHLSICNRLGALGTAISDHPVSGSGVTSRIVAISSNVLAAHRSTLN